MHVFYLLQFARFDFVRIRQVLDELKVTLGGETEGKKIREKKKFWWWKRKNQNVWMIFIFLCFMFVFVWN